MATAISPHPRLNCLRAVSDELFFVEQERSVLADNTFSLKNTRFEAPRDLRGRKVQIRFARLKFDRAIV